MTVIDLQGIGGGGIIIEFRILAEKEKADKPGFYHKSKSGSLSSKAVSRNGVKISREAAIALLECLRHVVSEADTQRHDGGNE